MKTQSPIVLLSALFCCYGGAEAWIFKGPTFQTSLPSTCHVTDHRSKIVSSSRWRLGLSSKVFDGENENGSVSSSSSRRSFIEQSASFLLLPAASIAASFPANAKYGDGTSMELPSYIDYLIEKNTAADNSNALYKGADPATVLKRLAESERRLGEIEELAEKKKWSEINGLITGPLGTLGSSMSQVVSIASASGTAKKTKQVEQAVKKVKADVFAIGQEASRKSPEGCTQQAQLASKDLKILLEIAFE